MFTKLFRSQSLWAVHAAGIPSTTFLTICRHFVAFVETMRARYPDYVPSSHCSAERFVNGQIVPVNNAFLRIVLDFSARYSLPERSREYLGALAIERVYPDVITQFGRYNGITPNRSLLSETGTIALELFYDGFDDFRIVRPMHLEKTGMRERVCHTNGETKAATRYRVTLASGESIACVGHAALLLEETNDSWWILARENDTREFRLKPSRQFSKWGICVRNAVRRNVEFRLGRKSLYIDDVIAETAESMFSRPKHQFEFPIHEMREAGLFNNREWRIVDAWYGYGGDMITAAESIGMPYRTFHFQWKRLLKRMKENSPRFFGND